MRLSETCLKALNGQIAHEYQNHFIYAYYQSWAAFNGLTNIENLFREQSFGEILHANMIKEFVLERDGAFDFSAFVMPGLEVPGDIGAVFDAALELEQGTTEAIKSVVEASESEGDLQTTAFLLNELLPDQIEEEDTFYKITARLATMGDMPGKEHALDLWVQEEFGDN